MKYQEMTTDQKAAFVRNADAWISSLTGAGTSADKFASLAFASNAQLDNRTLEELYTDDDLAATIVERKVHDALRGGYELEWDGATDEETRDVVDWAESEYNLTEAVQRARIYSRLWGGGGIFMGMPGALDSPAMMGDEVTFLRPIPSTELIGDSWYADPTQKNFGQVATYRLHTPRFLPTYSKRTEDNYIITEVHESRVIPFYGVRTSDTQQWRDNGWGKSVLHRVYSVLLKFESSFDSVLHTLLEQSIPRYKVKALLELLASENGELLAKRFELINTAKSAYRAVIIDQEEEFDRVEANLGPSSDVVSAAMVRVAGAAGMPVTILFGREPAGQNATGKSDLENWNQQVASEQSLVLGPAIEKVYRHLLAQKGSPLRKVPDNLQVNFPVVETLSRQEQINAYAQIAGADAVYKDMGAVTASEIAKKRSKQKGTLFPAVDMSYLKELDDLHKDQLLNPPDPMEMAAEEEPDSDSEETESSDG